jgi:hypothetical protein
MYDHQHISQKIDQGLPIVDQFLMGINFSCMGWSLENGKISFFIE